MDDDWPDTDEGPTTPKERIEQFLNEVTNYLNPDALKFDGFNDCIIGVGNQFSKSPVLIYDEMLIFDQLVESGLEPDEAWEHMSHNIAGAWVGEGTPIIMSHVNDH